MNFFRLITFRIVPFVIVFLGLFLSLLLYHYNNVAQAQSGGHWEGCMLTWFGMLLGPPECGGPPPDAVNCSWCSNGLPGFCPADWCWSVWVPDAPSCSPNQGQSCGSSPNSCGMVGSGTYDCSGSCSASTPSDALCSCANGSPGPYPSCPVCVPNSSCAASTCSSSTCSDSCGNVYAGTMFCGGCSADPSCAASTCTGNVCFDSCGNMYSGTRFCGGCVADPSCAASTCLGDVCTDSCGNSYNGTAFCPSDSLKICENSCSSGLERSGSSFSMATGSTRNLVSCWNTASDCSDSSGNVTSSTMWGVASSMFSITLSGTNPQILTALSPGNGVVTARYSGQNASTNVSVSCVPSVTCATAPEGTNHCPSDTYTINDGCGATLTCNGRRACDFNWKEVAP